MWTTMNYGTGKKENYYNENEYKKPLLRIKKYLQGRKIADEVRIKSILHIIDEVLKNENEQKG